MPFAVSVPASGADVQAANTTNAATRITRTIRRMYHPPARSLAGRLFVPDGRGMPDDSPDPGFDESRGIAGYTQLFPVPGGRVREESSEVLSDDEGGRSRKIRRVTFP